MQGDKARQAKLATTAASTKEGFADGLVVHCDGDLLPPYRDGSGSVPPATGPESKQSLYDRSRQPAEADGQRQRSTAKKLSMRGRVGAFAAAARAAPMAMVITDATRADNPIVFANASFCHLTGFSQGEVIGRNCRFLQGPETDPMAVDRIRRAIIAAEAIAIDIRNHRKDGTAFWSRLMIVPVLGPDGRVAYFFASNVDLTPERETLDARTGELALVAERLRLEAFERERAQDALRQSQKMEAFGQLAGCIAHDFNNALQSISGSLELMLHRAEQGAPLGAERLLGGMRESVGRAGALTARLLAFARGSAFEPRPVSPNAVIDSMMELFRCTAGQSIAIEVMLGGRGDILCDGNEFENALLNLVINARDAMLPGGKLAIGTRDVDREPDTAAPLNTKGGRGWLEVSVSDDGAGMDASTRSRALEPFFTTKPVGRGTGLGLSQVQGFVERAGGEIILESAEGRGTTIRLQLPRH